MQLVEIHNINTNHAFFKECADLTFRSKNIYNVALYNIRQHYFNNKSFLPLSNGYKLLKQSSDYKALPAKVGNQVLKQVDQNFKSFFALRKKGLAAKIPRYKDSESGKNIVIYEKGAISKKLFDKKNIIQLSQTGIKIKTKIQNFDSIKQARIIPYIFGYKIEIIYEKQSLPVKTEGQYAGCDIGLNNMATVGYENGSKPFIINGRPVKSINQFYNKRLSQLKSKLKNGQKTSKRIKRLTNKRNNKIKDYLHKASHILINQIDSQRVKTLIVGHNKEWKQEINIGRKNNQNFVNIPHSKFISMLKYKGALIGIEVREREESYTSKCSFLDNEPICKRDEYLGKRIKRGLFRSYHGNIINADVNGMYNILKKEVPNAFANGIEGVAVHPVVLTIKG